MCALDESHAAEPDVVRPHSIAMYTNCLFCPSTLGKNRVLEHFPVSRTIAFDLHRGRLWAVCPRCGRWNLCPFDERWETLDDCARLSETALVQESTSEISLLRHRSGVSLIRVGQPTLGELVSWRYARNLVRRRRNFGLAVGAVSALGAVSLFGIAAGAGGAASLLGSLGGFHAFWDILRPVIDLTTADGTRLRITKAAARGIWFAPDQSAGVTLRIRSKNAGVRDISGEDVGILLARAMPYINETGGTADSALLAAQEIAERGGAEGFLSSIASDAALHRRSILGRAGSHARREGAIYKFPKSIQLGLEAASHMRQEDGILSGEMRSILTEWRSAAELAEISDSLLEPPGWANFKQTHLADKTSRDAV